MHAAVRVVRLTSWGLSASLVAFTAFASDAGGFLDGGTAPWLLAAQFAVALAVGLVLLDRNREAAANALRSAALLALLACIFGIADAGAGSFELWHLALTDRCRRHARRRRRAATSRGSCGSARWAA